MTIIDGDARVLLRNGVERIEAFEEQIRDIRLDVNGEYAVLKAKGFDPRIVRKVVALRRKSEADRDEEALLIDSYQRALGMGPLERLADEVNRAAGDKEAAE